MTVQELSEKLSVSYSVDKPRQSISKFKNEKVLPSPVKNKINLKQTTSAADSSSSKVKHAKSSPTLEKTTSKTKNLQTKPSPSLLEITPSMSKNKSARSPPALEIEASELAGRRVTLHMQSKTLFSSPPAGMKFNTGCNLDISDLESIFGADEYKEKDITHDITGADIIHKGEINEPFKSYTHDHPESLTDTTDSSFSEIVPEGEKPILCRKSSTKGFIFTVKRQEQCCIKPNDVSNFPFNDPQSDIDEDIDFNDIFKYMERKKTTNINFQFVTDEMVKRRMEHIRTRENSFESAHNLDHENITAISEPDVLKAAFQVPTNKYSCGVHQSSEDSFEWSKLMKHYRNDPLLIYSAHENSYFQYTLPIEMNDLVGMTPMQYLYKYCRIVERRQYMYEKEFRLIQEVMYSKVFCVVKDIYDRLNNVLVQTMTKEQFADMIELLCLQPKDELDMRSFFLICAITERLLFVKNINADTFESLMTLPMEIEKVDFSNLKYKLLNVSISKELQKLFDRLLEINNLNPLNYRKITEEI